MAGYTRQSVADIINGADITAPPVNAEFNQIASAFNGATGHSHDGSTGNAPKINLATSLTGYLPAVHGGTGGKNNFSATTNPAATDDAGDGYAPGSMWENTTTGRIFICVGNTANAAVWRELVQIETSNVIKPISHDGIDLGTPTVRFQDLYLSGGIGASGNVSLGGTLNVTGATTLTGAATANGGLTVNGTTALSGSVTIGDPLSSLDTISVGAGFTSNLVPSTNAGVSLGTSSTQWNNLYIDGTATIDTLTVDENATVAGTLGVTGTSTLSTANITNITATGTINLAGATVSNLGTVTTAAIGGGSLNNVVIGGSTPAAITGTTITGTSLVGPLTGNVVGNVTGNLTGNVLGNVTGNLTGNVTATSGTSNFTNVTISGQLNMDATSAATITNLSAPVNDNDAARKIDVDTAVANLVDSAPDSLNTLNELAAAINDDASAYNTLNTAIGNKLPKSGGTMSGAINMGGQKITNAADPTSAQDLATKNYIDTTYVDYSSAGDAATDARKLATNAEDVQYTLADGTTTGYSALHYAAKAAASYDSFDDRYLGSKASDPTLDNDNNALITGALYFDSTNGVMKVYNGTEWANASSSIEGIKSNFYYTATSGQTAFSGSDDNSNTLVIDKAGLVNVYMNGVRLHEDDYTVSAAGDSVTLAAGAATGDLIYLEVFGNFAGQSGADVAITGGSITGLTELGIGVSDLSAYYDNWDDLVLGGSAQHSGITIVSGSAYEGTIAFADGTSGNERYRGYIQYNHTNDRLVIGTAATTAATIDSSGNLLVGTTDDTLYNNTTGGGFKAGGDGRTDMARQGDIVATMNRTGNSDGTILNFRKDGAEVGSIGTNTGRLVIHGTNTGIRFESGELMPTNGSGVTTDNAVDVGHTTYRFRDMYLAGDITLGASHFIGNGGGNNLEVRSGSGENLVFKTSLGVMTFGDSSGSEYCRLDANGNLLVGKTSTSGTIDGVTSYGSGAIEIVRTSNPLLYLNQQGTDKDIIKFRKDNADIGAVTAVTGGGQTDIMVGSDATALWFGTGTSLADSIAPASITGGGTRSNAISLGHANAKFKDLYLSGGIKIVSPDTTSAAAITFGDSADSATGSIGYFNSDDSLRFSGYNNQERLRIDSSGRAAFGTTSTYDTSWGSTSNQLTINGSRYGVMRIENNGGSEIATRYHYGVGDGKAYMAYDDVNGVHRMVIDVNGGIGFNGEENADDYYANNMVLRCSDEGGLTLRSTSTQHAAYIMFADGTSNTGRYRYYLGHDHANDVTYNVSYGEHRFFTADGSDGVKHTATFNQHGLTFNGDTAAANALDDYEEGTWTPTLRFNQNASGITYTTQDGQYTKIGNMVYVNGVIALTNKGSNTGSATIGGLPFSAGDYLTSTSHENAIIWNYWSNYTDTSAPYPRMYATGSTIILWLHMGGTLLTDTSFSNATSMRFSGWYMT